MTAATPAPNHNRFAFLDVCRAVAALAVVIQHAGEASGLFGLEEYQFSHGVFSFGQMGVVLFFLISGYIIPKSLESSGNIKQFWIRRVFRLYPLYFVIMAATIAIAMFIEHRPAPEPLHLAAHLVFVQSWVGFPNYVGGSWTLFIELLWYFIFAVLFFLKLNRRHFLVFYGPIAGLLALAALSLILDIRLPFGRFSMVAACFMGLLWLRYNDGVVSRRFFQATIAAYCVTLLICFYIGFHVIPAPIDEESPKFIAMVITWLVGLYIFGFSYRFRLHNPMLQYLGMISYSVYLVHSPVITVLKSVGMTGHLIIPAVLVLTVLIGSLTYKMIEEPFMNMGRKLS